MIELIYNEEEDVTTEERKFEEPKNVKQIGDPKDYKKIYIEDYVHTFLQQYSREERSGVKAAVLFGKSGRSQGKRYLYVKSALPVEEISEKQGKYCFTDNVWGSIYRQCEVYFPGQEIVGWFLANPGFPVEKTAAIEETQRTYFSGADKVFFMMEPVEGESGFFCFDGNRFARQSGYYIYYEKNEPMQNYLIEKNRKIKRDTNAEKQDMVMANFRNILKEKHARNEKRKRKALSAVRKAAVFLLLLMAGVLLKDQADKIQLMEQQLNSLSGEKQVEEASVDAVIVEDLPGEVEEQEAEAEIPVTEQPEEPIEEPVEEEVQETVAETPVYREYVVCAGDTLAKISRDAYGTDARISEICSLNGIENGDYIQEGQIILLP